MGVLDAERRGPGNDGTSGDLGGSLDSPSSCLVCPFLPEADRWRERRCGDSFRSGIGDRSLRALGDSFWTTSSPGG